LLETIEAEKRKPVDVDVYKVKQKQRKKHAADDFKFIETYSEINKTKNWKKIFNEGKSKGLFDSYTSANSLKSSYHHAKKRLKN
jgi:hypothetical protein